MQVITDAYDAGMNSAGKNCRDDIERVAAQLGITVHAVEVSFLFRFIVVIYPTVIYFL